MSNRVMVKVVLLIVAAMIAAKAAVNDTYFVMLMLFVPLAAMVLGLKNRKIIVPVSIAWAIGFIAAYAFHAGMAHVLGGFIRSEELIWSTVFFAGCFTLMWVFDRALQKLVERRIRKPVFRSLARLVLVLLILPPAMVATMQVVRVKIGYNFPLTAEVAERFVTRAVDGVPIQGDFINRHAATTLIVVQGLGAHSENFLPYLTTAMADRKINGLIFDLRGHGYSGGHVSSFGYHEQKDMEAVIDWLKARPLDATGHGPAEHLIVYAFSMGSAAAILDAPRHPEIDGLIIDSGFARLSETAWSVAARFPLGLRYSVYYAGIPLASLIAQAPLRTINPIETLERIRAPVLVFHGTEDVIVDPAQGAELLAVKGVAGRMIQGGLHTNLANTDTRYFTDVGRFIDILLRLAQPDDPHAPVAPGIGAPK